jgi:hypothetical protein
MSVNWVVNSNRIVPSDRDFEKIFEPIGHVDTYNDEGEPIPGAVAKWEKALNSIGLWRVAEYPVDKYGAGCAIFQIDDGGPETEGYEFLACLDLSHDEPIYVGLRNAVDYIEFHGIIQPMLMMQSEQRFQADRDKDDVWDGGTYRDGFELKGSEAEDA